MASLCSDCIEFPTDADGVSLGTYTLKSTKALKLSWQRFADNRTQRVRSISVQDWEAERISNRRDGGSLPPVADVSAAVLPVLVALIAARPKTQPQPLQVSHLQNCGAGALQAPAAAAPAAQAAASHTRVAHTHGRAALQAISAPQWAERLMGTRQAQPQPRLPAPAAPPAAHQRLLPDAVQARSPSQTATDYHALWASASAELSTLRHELQQRQNQAAAAAADVSDKLHAAHQRIASQAQHLVEERKRLVRAEDQCRHSEALATEHAAASAQGATVAEQLQDDLEQMRAALADAEQTIAARDQSIASLQQRLKDAGALM